jgi:HEAT repeat protein/beta-lactamase regulating signal transducer with metallopeptidase domain
MSQTLGATVAAWLATYAIHSTLLIGGVALYVKWRAPSAAVRDFAWKLALTGAIATATIQLTANVRPVGSVAFERPVAAVVKRSTVATPLVASADENVAPASATDEPTSALASDAAHDVAPSAPTTSTPVGAASSSTDAAARITTYVVIAWGAVALLLALTYLARRLMLAGRLVTRRPVTEGRLHTLLGVVQQETGFTAPVTLTAASTISSPVALGLAEICVPEVALTDLDEDQQRGLLAHELAHLARRDPLWLDVASLLERVFFFQPLNRFARRALQQNAEYICDDWAATHTGSGEPLARCLARVAEWIEASPLGVPVAGMAEQRSLLVTRISRLLEDTPVRIKLSRMTMAVATTAALIAVVAAVPAVHATAPQQGSDSTETRRERDARRESGPISARLALRAAEREAMRATTVQTEAGNFEIKTSMAMATLARTNRGHGEPDDSVEQDPAVVTALIERLGDSSASVRRAAAQSLGRLHARRAVGALITALGDKSREVRAAAADALGDLEDAKAIPALVKLMTDESPEVREQAINALSRFESDVPAAPMIAALSDGRADVRARAADMLGKIGDRAAIAPLSKLLKDPSADVRREALQSLAHFNDASAGPAMLSSLDDANAEVRAAALQALRSARITIPEATTLKLLADGSRDVRHQAVESLREQPLSPALVTALTKIINDDASGEVKESAVETLAEARNPAARDAIKGALNSPDARVRRAAAEALGNRP